MYVKRGKWKKDERKINKPLCLKRICFNCVIAAAYAKSEKVFSRSQVKIPTKQFRQIYFLISAPNLNSNAALLQ